MAEESNTAASPDWRGSTRAWSDPFVRPSESDLLAHYSNETRSLVEALCQQVASLDGISMQMRWQGPAWCWTFTFVHPALSEDGAAQFAYLIPHPDGLRFVLPINEPVLSEFSLDKTPAYVCKTIETAPHPYEWWWPEWVVQSTEQADWLVALAQAKHLVLTERRS
jgi:hypothetical protein